MRNHPHQHTTHTMDNDDKLNFARQALRDSLGEEVPESDIEEMASTMAGFIEKLGDSDSLCGMTAFSADGHQIAGAEMPTEALNALRRIIRDHDKAGQSESASTMCVRYATRASGDTLESGRTNINHALEFAEATGFISPTELAATLVVYDELLAMRAMEQSIWTSMLTRLWKDPNEDRTIDQLTEYEVTALYTMCRDQLTANFNTVVEQGDASSLPSGIAERWKDAPSEDSSGDGAR